MKLKFDIEFDTNTLKLDIYPVKPRIFSWDDKEQSSAELAQWQELT